MTGVQTCALPISPNPQLPCGSVQGARGATGRVRPASPGGFQEPNPLPAPPWGSVPPGRGSRGGFAVAGSRWAPSAGFLMPADAPPAFPGHLRGPTLRSSRSEPSGWSAASPHPPAFTSPRKVPPPQVASPWLLRSPLIASCKRGLPQRPDPRAARQFRARRAAWNVVLARAIAWVPWSRAPRWHRRSCRRNLVSGKGKIVRYFGSPLEFGKLSITLVWLHVGPRGRVS